MLSNTLSGLAKVEDFGEAGKRGAITAHHRTAIDAVAADFRSVRDARECDVGIVDAHIVQIDAIPCVMGAPDVADGGMPGKRRFLIEARFGIEKATDAQHRFPGGFHLVGGGAPVAAHLAHDLVGIHARKTGGHSA